MGLFSTREGRWNPLWQLLCYFLGRDSLHSQASHASTTKMWDEPYHPLSRRCHPEKLTYIGFNIRSPNVMYIARWVWYPGDIRSMEEVLIFFEHYKQQNLDWNNWYVVMDILEGKKRERERSFKTQILRIKWFILWSWIHWNAFFFSKFRLQLT